MSVRSPQDIIIRVSNDLVFQTLAPIQPSPNIVPIPQYTSFNLDILPISERKIDYCFIGHSRTPIRNAIRHNLKTYAKNNNNNGFTSYYLVNKELSYDKYIELMCNSKVSICMPGTKVDNLRYVESAACGNIIICPKKPPYWYYKNKYEFQLADWQLLIELLNRIFSIPQDELNITSQLTYQYYHEVLNPNKICHYMRYFIERHLNGSL